MLAHERLPSLGRGAAVQPCPDVKQRGRGEQGGGALRQLAAGPGNGHEVGGGVPGGAARDHGGHPAGVDPGQCISPTGFAHEGDNRRQHQDGLQPLAQQDQQRRHEGGGRRQPLPVQPVGGLLQQTGDAFNLRGHIVGPSAPVDGRAQTHHVALDFQPQCAVDRVELSLDQLETLQIGADGVLPRPRAIAPRTASTASASCSRA